MIAYTVNTPKNKADDRIRRRRGGGSGRIMVVFAWRVKGANFGPGWTDTPASYGLLTSHWAIGRSMGGGQFGVGFPGFLWGLHRGVGILMLVGWGAGGEATVDAVQRGDFVAFG